ncbi:MAG: ABC transporter ATP-binding protein [Bdellovibrionales bacterium]|nr:ABC transporter ATP-binding protein [Bdellovibrionales bacterium]
MSIFSINNVSFSYPNGTHVFSSLDLEVSKGEIVGVLGPNGSGKSTLFGLLTKQMMPTSGQILCEGQPIENSKYMLDVGCVFQSISLDPLLTVFENLWLQGVLYEIPSLEIKKRIEALATQFQFDLMLSRRVKYLSGGYARRVEIAKSLIHQPKIILLDEPSTGLDPKSRLDLFQWIELIKTRRDITVVWISHYTDEVQKMDRVVMLHEGKIVCDGKPHELVNQLSYFHVQAKMKSDHVIDAIEGIAQDIALQGDRLSFRIEKDQLHQSLTTIIPHVEFFMYREPNLEDVYLEKTGVYFS